MSQTALEEIKRLADEVRRAKQKCLALFVSLQVSAEELRQIKSELGNLSQILEEARSENVVNLKQYQVFAAMRYHNQLLAKSLEHQITWEAGSELAGKLSQYRELLAQFNQYLDVANYIAPVIEFRRDH